MMMQILENQLLLAAIRPTSQFCCCNCCCWHQSDWSPVVYRPVIIPI